MSWVADNDQWGKWWFGLAEEARTKIVGAMRLGRIGKGSTEAECRELVVIYAAKHGIA